MIFKVQFNNAVLVSGGDHKYVSFCSNKLKQSGRSVLQNLLYDSLYKLKIINFPANIFSYEIIGRSPFTITCYISYGKCKWFCKLRELTSYQYNSPDYYNTAADKISLQDAIHILQGRVAERAAEALRMQADDDIIYPHRGQIDHYQGMQARRTLLVDQLPQGALPVYDREIDLLANMPLDIEPINDE